MGGLRPDHKRDASCVLCRETERLLVWFQSVFGWTKSGSCSCPF